jgi:hypothetical protein
MAVPYTFGTATAAIPLSQLDSNFATAITLGNTAVYLGNTTTSIGNLTLANVTISSGSVTITDVTASGNVTLSGGTANGVAYLNGSKVLTTGSALTFDGTNLGVGTATLTNRITVKGADSSSGGINILGTGSNGLRLFQDGSGGDSYISNYQAGSLIFAQNNAEGMRLTSTGLGIGTTSPAVKLEIGGTNPTINIGATNSASGAALSYNTSGNYFSINAVTQGVGYRNIALATDGGNVGVGISSPTYPLTVQANSSTQGIRLIGRASDNIANVSFVANNGSTEYAFINTGATYLALGVNSAERARIDSSGNLLVGTTTAVSGSSHIVVGSNSIQGIKKDFSNLSTAQSFGFSASNAGVYVANLKSVGGASVAFLIACTFDNSAINMFTTSLGGCTAGGSTGTITGINGDARIYTFTRNSGTGLFEVTASSTATGTTTIYLTPLNVFA